MKGKIFVFDIDDTLYKEIDFLKSGYHAIATHILKNFSLELNPDVMLKQYFQGENVFQNIVNQVKSSTLSLDYLLDIYRNHLPDIKLDIEIFNKLEAIKSQNFKIGLLTDGRSITQRNKISALALDKFADDIIISEEIGVEKPNEQGYQFFMNKYPDYYHYYIGDNIAKDFITPNQLHWTTIGILDHNNQNIHSQSITVKKNNLPQYWIKSVADLKV